MGCKVNSYESAFIKQELKKIGYEDCKIDENPSVIVINTCSVTNKADAKSRHLISKAKRLNPDAIIVTCGCSVQNDESVFKDLGADIIVGNFGKSEIPELIKVYVKEKTFVEGMKKKSNVFENMLVQEENDKTRAFVKIQDGCNNYCSYCIIPYLRGNIRSKDIDLAEKEINMLVSMGHKEIVLTGIHTGAYGKGTNYDLVDLIKRISKNENLERIRISSIEITELNDKFLNELKNNEKIVNHMHIPLQSGSDLILKKMNRKYDTKYFLEKIKKIRKIRPLMNVTTDIIVGFPYETDEEFAKELDFIKKIKFTKIHAFPFSLRKGTLAEKMKDGFVKDIIKKQRMKEILELSKKLENEYYKKFIGKTLEVIVENKNKGHTENYIMVNLDRECATKEKVKVLIENVKGETVYGKVLE